MVQQQVAMEAPLREVFEIRQQHRHTATFGGSTTRSCQQDGCWAQKLVSTRRNTVVQQQTAIEALRREVFVMRHQQQQGQQAAPRRASGGTALQMSGAGAAAAVEPETPRLRVRPQGASLQ